VIRWASDWISHLGVQLMLIRLIYGTQPGPVFQAWRKSALYLVAKMA